MYCDPPYASATEQYRFLKRSGIDFDNDKFWKWCDSQDIPIFVSEYTAPENFTPIWQKGKTRLMSQRGADGKVIEYLFVQSRFAQRYQTELPLIF